MALVVKALLLRGFVGRCAISANLRASSKTPRSLNQISRLVVDRVTCIPISALRSSRRMNRRARPSGTFEVFHKYALKFEGYLLSCAKMPTAKESDPD